MRMPRKGTTKVTDRQKRILAAARAGGVSVEKAAAAAGIAKGTAYKALADPGTRNLFREIKAAHSQELAGLYGLIVSTLAEDLEKAENEASRAKLRQEALQLVAYFEPQISGGSQAGGEAVTGPATAPTLGEILVRFNGSSSQGQHAPTHPVSNGTTP